MAYVENLEQGSGLPEYLIFLLCMVVFFSPERARTPLVAISASILTYKLVFMGYRVQALMLFILIYYIFIEHRIKTWMIVALIIIAFLGMSWFGYMKDGKADMDLVELIFDASNGFVLSHQTGVIYSSMTVLGAIDSGHFSVSERFWSFFGTSINFVVPSRLVRDLVPEFNVALYIQTLFQTAGGVLFTVAFYTWFGIAGPIGLGLLFGRIPAFAEKISRSTNASSIFWGAFLFCLFVAFPRWVSYDIGNFMVRLPLTIGLLTLLIYALVPRAKTSSTTPSVA